MRASLSGIIFPDHLGGATAPDTVALVLVAQRIECDPATVEAAGSNPAEDAFASVAKTGKLPTFNRTIRGFDSCRGHSILICYTIAYGK